MLMEVNEYFETHNECLRMNFMEIMHLQSRWQQTLLELDEIAESNEVSKTFQYISENEKFSKLPLTVNVTMPNFIPKQIPNHVIREELIGKFTPSSTMLK